MEGYTGVTHKYTNTHTHPYIISTHYLIHMITSHYLTNLLLVFTQTGGLPI